MMTKKGFTIIEVSLVIAIGGLIFLMVFIAVPGLRAAQRDTERRENVIHFIDQLKKYQTNNRGSLPTDENLSTDGSKSVDVNLGADQGITTWGGFYNSFLGDNFRDPDGEEYRLNLRMCQTKEVDKDCDNGELRQELDKSENQYKIFVVLQAQCKGEGTVRTGNPRKVAVLYRLERAGV